MDFHVTPLCVSNQVVQRQCNLFSVRQYRRFAVFAQGTLHVFRGKRLGFRRRAELGLGYGALKVNVQGRGAERDALTKSCLGRSFP